MKVRFVVLEPESKRGAYDVPLPIVVGRGNEARFRIQQDRISRKHCELFHRDGDVYVRDLGSTNGTFLDGEQIPSSIRTPVPPGSVLTVGSIEIRIEYEGTGRLVSPKTAATTTTTIIEDPTIGVEGVDMEAEAEPLEAQAEAQIVAEAEAVPEAEPAEPQAATIFMETTKAPEPADLADLEVAEPASDSIPDITFGDPPPAAEGSFDFLGGSPGSGAADDDQLGDFFKGLK